MITPKYLILSEQVYMNFYYLLEEIEKSWDLDRKMLYCNTEIIEKTKDLRIKSRNIFYLDENVG